MASEITPQETENHLGLLDIIQRDILFVISGNDSNLNSTEIYLNLPDRCNDATIQKIARIQPAVLPRDPFILT